MLFNFDLCMITVDFLSRTTLRFLHIFLRRKGPSHVCICYQPTSQALQRAPSESTGVPGAQSSHHFCRKDLQDLTLEIRRRCPWDLRSIFLSEATNTRKGQWSDGSILYKKLTLPFCGTSMYFVWMQNTGYSLGCQVNVDNYTTCIKYLGKVPRCYSQAGKNM